LLSRRQLLKGAAVLGFGTASFGGYAMAETFLTGVTRYRLSPPGWPHDLKLRLAVLADIHACDPWMSAARVRGIAEAVNRLAPDATLLLGDFVAGHRLGKFGRPVAHKDWAGALAVLKAPLGVHAVLGNHDWWEDVAIQRRRSGPVKVRRSLEDAGIAVFENDAVRVEKDGHAFWLAGLGDQWAFWPTGERARSDRSKIGYTGVDDLSGTLAQITDDAPVVLMAHEPDIFPRVPARVSLTICGHTHGGQIKFGGFAPIVPSRFGRRYVYGHIVEDSRHLIVSGGLGCSMLPIRFGAPPEIVLIELGGDGGIV
jgi:uncharacterized protein